MSDYTLSSCHSTYSVFIFHHISFFLVSWLNIHMYMSELPSSKESSGLFNRSKPQTCAFLFSKFIFTSFWCFSLLLCCLFGYSKPWIVLLYNWGTILLLSQEPNWTLYTGFALPSHCYNFRLLRALKLVYLMMRFCRKSCFMPVS